RGWILYSRTGLETQTGVSLPLRLPLALTQTLTPTHTLYWNTSPPQLTVSPQERQITTYPNQKPWMNTRKADLKRGIKKAKQAYKLKVEEYFVYSDPRRMWQGIQAITDYKPSNSTQTVMNVSFLNELNDFYARFDKDNKDMTIKPKPSDYHQTLTLSPTDVQNALSQINARMQGCWP
ncbi:hypothetical protein L3Q82_017149, partial [Scortum barcoo]